MIKMNFNDFFKTAKYVHASSDNFFPYIRKTFNVNAKVKSAKLVLSALGFCDIFLNGKKITEDLYVTPHAMYNPQYADEFYINPSGFKQDYFIDELGYSVYVSEFDLTDLINEGKNAFSMLLSGGWYYTGPDKYKNYRNFGRPKACFRIEVTLSNGEVVDIVSDESTKWQDSFLTFAGIFHEEQDERKEIFDFAQTDYDDSKWENVVVAEHYNDAKFIKNICPPNRVIKYFTPKLIKQTAEEKIFDVGATVTGVAYITSASEEGQTITITYGEELNEQGLLDDFHCYEQRTIIVTDKRTEHGLRMTWHGFRYFSVKTTGNLDAIDSKKVSLIHADIKNTSEFKCNLDVVNFLYNAYIITQQENYQCGVPCDCPQIERKGYTGDGQVLCELGISLFDSENLYRKWMNDISDVQDRKTGFVHNTAPVFASCGGGPGGWSVAIVNVPYAFYKFHGDKEILEKYYPQMKLYADFMDSESINGLVSIHKRQGAHCLGDWSGPYKPFLPEPFCNSCMYVEALYRMKEVAKILGKEEDIPSFDKRIEYVKSCINREYYNPETGDYCGNEQGSNAFALNIGLGDERTLKNLADRYAEYKGFDTGIFGTKYLPKILFKNGFADVALGLYTSDNEVSYKAWMDRGETTLMESWLNTRSHNHPMFGSPILWLYEYVLGIRQEEGSVAHKNVLINPSIVKDITDIEGSLLTKQGRIKVAYKKTADGVDFTVVIPEGVNAKFAYGEYTKALVAGENKFSVKI